MKINYFNIKLTTIKILCVFTIFTITSLAKAESEKILATEDTSTSTGLEFKTETTLPVFVGLGLGYVLHPKFDISLYYGLTPEPYYQLIGQMAAQYGGNSSYKDVIVAAFQNNSVLKFQMNYDLEEKNTGWSIGVAAYQIKSSGQAGIDTVLAAATGNDYTTLKNLLVALGRSTAVDMNSQIAALEIRGSYNWPLQKNGHLKISAGVVKAVSAEVQLKTGLTNFENSQIGSNLMRQSESDLEKIVVDNGLSPTLGAEYSYKF